MKTRIETKSLLLGALLGAAAVAGIAAATENDRRTAWEYRVVTGRGFAD